MSTYHLSCRRLQRSQGHSASGSSAYRLDMLMTDPWDGRRYDQRNRHSGEDVEHFFVGPDGFDVGIDPAEFFAGVDAHERRKDATVGKEFTAAIPAELTREQAREWVLKEFAQRFAAEQRITSVAIHWKPENPHAHLWASDREWSSKGWGEKVKRWDQPAHLKAVREHFANVQNAAYARAGLECRVDHRSHKDRGLDYEPQRHEGRAPRDEILDHNARHARERVEAYERERAAYAREEKHYEEIAHHTALHMEQLARDADGEIRLLEIERAAAEKQRGGLADRMAAAEAKNAPIPRFGKAEIFSPSSAAPGEKKGSMADRMQAAEDGAKKDHRARAAETGLFGKRRAPQSIERPIVGESPQPKAPEPEYGPR